MGVTIHFEGRLKSEEDYDDVMAKATDFAKQNKMDYKQIEEDEKLLRRVRNQEDWDYNGATKGIRIEPAENCDPFNLEFDADNYIQEYCKTQFADINIHISIIDFLKTLQPNFEDLKVVDEGEYWETGNKETLINHIKTCFHQMEWAKENDPNLDGPFIVGDGRIADLKRVE